MSFSFFLLEVTSSSEVWDDLMAHSYILTVETDVAARTKEALSFIHPELNSIG